MRPLSLAPRKKLKGGGGGREGAAKEEEKQRPRAASADCFLFSSRDVVQKFHFVKEKAVSSSN